MGKINIISHLSKPFKSLFSREHTIVGQQRLLLLLACYLPVMLLGLTANFIGITEPSAHFFNYTHSALAALAIVCLCLFWKRTISVTVCLATFIAIGQTIISIEMLYCATRPSQYYIMLILANTVLLTMNTMVPIAAYMPKTTMALGACTIAVYIACSIIAGNRLLQSFIIVFAIAFTFVSLVGVWVARNTTKLENENTQLKHDEMEALHLLRLKRNDVKAYLSLASEKYSHDGVKVLIESLDKKSRYHLLANVEAYLKARDNDMSVIEKAFPEFTPSERAICQLILQGKKLGEICLALGKNESNINSQRANMRKKLGLQPADNLLQQLQRRIDAMP